MGITETSVEYHLHLIKIPSHVAPPPPPPIKITLDYHAKESSGHATPCHHMIIIQVDYTSIMHTYLLECTAVMMKHPHLGNCGHAYVVEVEQRIHGKVVVEKRDHVSLLGLQQHAPAYHVWAVDLQCK